MRLKTAAVLVVVSAVLLASQLTFATGAVQVQESSLRAKIDTEAIAVSVPVVAEAPGAVVMKVSLLDAADKVVAGAEKSATLSAGENTLTTKLPYKSSSDHDVPWYRLHYVLTAKDKAGVLAQGTVSVGWAVRDLFEIRTIHPRTAAEGKIYSVRLQAFNPVTSAPVGGVRIKGTLTFGDQEESDVKPISATTGSSGDAVLRFPVPGTVAGDDGEVKVEARSAGQLRTDHFDVELNKRGSVLITTDKVLYQPGQSFHARALAFDGDRRAIRDATIDFELKDPDNSTVFRNEVATNKFGIASVDWDLPDSLRLGDYYLAAEISAPERHSEVKGGSTVRVSRYDLPEFTVAAKPDRSYYLPGQNAEVDISGTYLFGKPVPHGSVRLVQEEDRHWDYATQRWVAEERAEQRGQLDPSGHAKFTIDLTKPQAELSDKDYRRFRDLNYGVYVTDASTGKTEQRRFMLRLSRDPIHLYVSHVTAIDKSVSFYVTTSYADGSPASCHIDIAEVIEKSRPEGDIKTSLLLRSVRTNRYGVAKVVHLRLSQDEEASSTEHLLTLQAHDNRGGSTRYEENVWMGSEYRAIQVTTDKALYAKGDPILVSLASKPMEGRVVVSALVKGAELWSANVSLRRGRTLAVVPYQTGFAGEVAITAYSVADDGDSWRIPFGARTVLYPHNNELKVSIKTGRSSYRPGEPVSADLRVASSDGTSGATALGVVVVDKAVEERVRTNEDFGGKPHGFWDWCWWYGFATVAGISRQDLDKFDLGSPLPDGLDLVAELLLNDYWYYDYSDAPEIERPKDYGRTASNLYRKNIAQHVDPMRRALLNDAVAGWKFPTTDTEVMNLLRAAGIQGSALRDPWDDPFKFTFDTDYRDRIIRIVSAGPDKRHGTADDMAEEVRWNYFTQTGIALDRAVKEAYAHSSLVIRDYDTLRSELLRNGIDLNKVRDPWGNPYVYRFEISGACSRVDVLSHGPQAAKSKSNGDLIIWSRSIEYFSKIREKLDAVLQSWRTRTGNFPQTEIEFDGALAVSDFSSFRALVDPWGHAYRLGYMRTRRYGDSVQVQAASAVTTQKSMPVTQSLHWVMVISDGPDGKANTADDITLATFSQIVAEQSAKDAEPRPILSPVLSGMSGAIEGTVVDQTGAVIAGATIAAEEEDRGLKFAGETDGKGAFALRVTPGMYRVTVAARGFQQLQYAHVNVHALSVTSLQVTMHVASTTETVTVEASSLQTVVMSSADVVTTVASRQVTGRAQVHEENFTPRLRDYFPETLYWAPSLITASNGLAKLNFKLADNITTWKMSVLASTPNGHVGAADAEIQAFQPFFVALDPPKVLTVGDRIDLPVTVRNYLPAPQDVQIEMKPAEWFKLLQPGKQAIKVPTGDSTNAVFPFVTLSPVKAGKQQVLAANRTTGDAIEKPVSVHPDGQEESRSATVLLRDSEPITLELPAEIMPDSLHAELKVYPNLLAHVGESIEASLERPYGCGEQTISSTYPSVLLLQYYKSAGLPDSDASRRARKYLKLGYQRLLNYRAAGGGFTYWGHGDADVALTAYAVRFLTDASSLIEIDEDIIPAAQRWLLCVQQSDGAWQPHYGHHQGTTAYVARILALSLKNTSDEKLKAKIRESVKKALKKLHDQQEPILEPYAMSLYALAASDSGNKEEAAAMVAKLDSLSHKEGNTTYWALETNTPFYGWGRAGRIESTAMALQALGQIDGESVATRDQISSGMLFLLKQKDRYGVWYSGQATANVLQAMLAILGRSPVASQDVSKAAVTVNGKAAGEVQISNSTAAGPVYLDVSQYLKPGANQIAVNRQGSGPYASVQAVATYYVPWKESSSVREITRLGESRALRLAVKFDKVEAQVGGTIRCSVQAERIGHHGYGMLLAEIGLPPGADVDRASLDKIIQESGWDISRYDVLPDRLILYLWPRAGGTKVDFTFHPRFGLEARSAPSLMYDYYNPDEQVTLTPVDFVVSAR